MRIRRARPVPARREYPRRPPPCQGAIEGFMSSKMRDERSLTCAPDALTMGGARDEPTRLPHPRPHRAPGPARRPRARGSGVRAPRSRLPRDRGRPHHRDRRRPSGRERRGRAGRATRDRRARVRQRAHARQRRHDQGSRVRARVLGHHHAPAQHPSPGAAGDVARGPRGLDRRHARVHGGLGDADVRRLPRGGPRRRRGAEARGGGSPGPRGRDGALPRISASARRAARAERRPADGGGARRGRRRAGARGRLLPRDRKRPDGRGARAGRRRRPRARPSPHASTPRKRRATGRSRSRAPVAPTCRGSSSTCARTSWFT